MRRRICLSIVTVRSDPHSGISDPAAYESRKMKAHLTRRYRFSASHRLHSEAMSAEENRDTYGKCNNPYGHGHNYVLEVAVSGQVDPATGMVCNLVDLDGFVEKEVLARYDIENLNML